MTFFTCIIDRDRRVTWDLRCGCHERHIAAAGLVDDTADKNRMRFARIIMGPGNASILNPSTWHLSVHLDGKPPVWWTLEHQQACHRACEEWLGEVYKHIVKKAVIDPFTIVPPEITEEHIRLLHEWAALFPTPGYGIETAMVRAGGRILPMSLFHSVKAEVSPIGEVVRSRVLASTGTQAAHYTGFATQAYLSSFFRMPELSVYQPAAALWESGLVPVLNDNRVWQLCGGPDGRVLWEDTIG